jgi:hypothetical protein
MVRGRLEDTDIGPASRRLQTHCQVRKYTQRAKSWFGVSISPGDISIRFGFNLEHEWQPSVEMETLTRENLRAEVAFAVPVGKEAW